MSNDNNDNKCKNLSSHDREFLSTMKNGIGLIIYYLKNGFYSEVMYNDKYIKTEIKIKKNTNF